MPQGTVRQTGSANQQNGEYDGESVRLEATDRVRGTLRLRQRTKAKKMANRFHDHGRSTGEQQKAPVELQDLATEGRRSHRSEQKHSTVMASTSKQVAQFSSALPVCERLAQT